MMATNSRRKRHRILALIAAGAMALVVALIVAVVWIMMRQPEKSETAVPPTAVPPSAVPPTGKPRPEFQDASCPDRHAATQEWISKPAGRRNLRHRVRAPRERQRSRRPRHLQRYAWVIEAVAS